MRTLFNVDVVHNGDITYYYDVKADNAPTAREKMVEKFIRDNNLPITERRNIQVTSY